MLSIRYDGDELRLIIRYKSRTASIEMNELEFERLVSADPSQQLVFILNKLKPREIKIDDINYLSQHVKEAFRRAYIEYKRNKVGIFGRQRVFEPPSRARVFIEKQLLMLTNPIPEIWQNGVSVRLYGYPPSITSVIKDVLVNRHDAVVGENKRIRFEEILLINGIDPNKPYEVNIINEPWLYVYKSNDIIIISREYLGVGEVEVYLKPVTLDELRQIYEELSDPQKNMFIRVLGRRFGIKRSNEESDESYRERVLNAATRVTFMAYRGVPDDIADYFIARWREIIAKAFPEETDQFMRLIYSGLVLPYPEVKIAPHMCIFTNTNAGKSLLYYLITGEQAYTDATPVSLAGGIDPATRKPAKGVLEGRDLPLQIEGLESSTARQTLSLLINYMKSGEILRASGVRTIKTRGLAPIIFTGNIVSTTRALTIQTLIKEGLLDNPEALSSRMIMFYRECRQITRFDLSELERTWSIIRCIRDNPTLKTILKRIWFTRQVVEWITEPDAIDVRIECRTELTDLCHYLEGMTRNISPRLKALAFNIVLFNNLDKIWKLRDKPSELQNLALELVLEARRVYSTLKGYLIESIGNILEDMNLITKGVIVTQLPTYLKILVLAAYKYVNKHSIMTPVVVTLDSMGEEINEAGREMGTKYSHASVKKLVEKNLPALTQGFMQQALSRAGISLSKQEDKILVGIDPQYLTEDLVKAITEM